MLITCPSGLRIQIRALKGGEARVLTDKNAARRVRVNDTILNACTLAVERYGPYASGDGRSVDWQRALIGDRVFALVKIREATMGAEYSFDVSCMQAFCRAVVPHTVHLDQMLWTPFDPGADPNVDAPAVPAAPDPTDVALGWVVPDHAPGEVVVKAFSPEALARFSESNRFETRVPSDGKQIVFKLLVGSDEVRFQKMAHQRRLGRGGGDLRPPTQVDDDSDIVITTALSRIVDIDGVKPQDWRDYLADLPFGDLTALFALFDAVDGGIETSIEVACGACGTTQAVPVPFDVRMWFPSRRRT